MVSLVELRQQLEQVQFDIEKADFNDNPTAELEEQLHQLQQELLATLQSQLAGIYPTLLPPLQIPTPRLELDQPLDNEIVEIIEDIGMDAEDEDLLLVLDGSNPDHHGILNLLGVHYIYQYQADQAAGYFGEVLDSTDLDYVLFNISYALAVQKVLSPAIDYLDRIGDSIDSALVHLNKGVIYDKLGRYDEVAQYFEAASEDPQYQTLALFTWGISASNFGKVPEAASLFKRVMQLEPTYPGLHQQLGNIAAQQGFYTEASQAFEIAHKDQPDNMELLSDLGTACLMANRLHDAIDYFLQYLDHKRELSVLNNLGAAYLQTQQYAKAVEILKEALEINPNHQQSQKNLEVAQSYLG